MIGGKYVGSAIYLIFNDLQVLTGGKPWTIYGQSFGGFCVTTYLSLAGDGVAAGLITGGLPPALRSADEVYQVHHTPPPPAPPFNYRARAISTCLAAHAPAPFCPHFACVSRQGLVGTSDPPAIPPGLCNLPMCITAQTPAFPKNHPCV
jgi:hypothetical protein